VRATAGETISLGRGGSVEVISVLGKDGKPPYVVRFPDGRVSEVKQTGSSRWSNSTYPAGCLFMLMAVLAGLPFLIVAGISNVPFGYCLLGAVVAVLISVEAIYLVRKAERRFGRWARLVYRPFLAAAVVAAETFSLIWLGSVYSDHQRCVDQQTMTVIPSSECQGEVTGNSEPVWYYGGSGLRVGDPVQGGSLNPPADDSGNGGGVSGDDGDDGGDDGGGGDGGGGDG
jgi:hypothetical protein